MKLLAFFQAAIAAVRRGLFLISSRALLKQVTPPTAQATRELLADFPDMVKLLTVMTLLQAILGSVCFHFDDNCLI
jgi:hypothetical protein